MPRRSAELTARYRGARVLQSLSVLSPLAKQVANYICLADVELTARGISAVKLPALVKWNHALAGRGLPALMKMT